MGAEKKKNPIRKFSRKMQAKLALLFVLIVLALFGLNIRLSYINMKSGDQYTKQVLSQQRYESKTLPYQRGNITDRNGIVLATSTKVYKLILDPKIILSDKDGNYLSATLAALSGCMGYDVVQLRAKIESNAESHYVIWDTNLSYEAIEGFQSLKAADQEERPEWFPKDVYKISDIQGVWFEEDYIRLYPYNTLACDVLGFSNSENVGSYGIEQYYNDALNGTNGRTYGYLDEDNDLQKVIKPAINGNTVVSTLDMNLQMIIEKWIADFAESTGAENIAVMMMNPNNGEILAMASSPTFDLNDPSNLSAFYTGEELAAMTSEEKMNKRYALWKNFCLSVTYEPGSTAKPLTVAAALNEGYTYDGDTFLCEGYLPVGGYDIHCHNRTGDGILTLEQSVMHSCNVAMMLLAQRMGKGMFSNYQQTYNIGRQTGIDLPGEEYGLVYTLSNMDDATLATNSFGQNFNVTMVQLAAAFASVINGGYYYEPHVMKKITDPSGGLVQNSGSALVKETVSNKTSKLMREYLYQTVESGTGMKAMVEGYTIGGKTGTAEKHPRDEGKYVVSFISFAPVENPEVLLYVVIDEPHVPSEQVSASFATIMSSQIYKEALPYLGIFPSKVQENAEPATETATTPQETGGEENEEEETVEEETTRERATEETAGSFMSPHVTEEGT